MGVLPMLHPEGSGCHASRGSIAVLPPPAISGYWRRREARGGEC
jgi:hypothetical protein